MTPHAVHYGHDALITQQRRETLMTAFTAHPQRFSGLAPKPPAVPTAVWINPPKQEIASSETIIACSLNVTTPVTPSFEASVGTATARTKITRVVPSGLD
jgi:hypothetical protein